MITYYISLKRAKERRSHVRRHVEHRGLKSDCVDAIDGQAFKDRDLAAFADLERVERMRWWLTNGAIACALSHKLAYERLLKSGERCAFIIEDDTWLPENIGEILERVKSVMAPDEVVLLMLTASRTVELSTVGNTPLWKDGPTLYYPMDLGATMCAAAYCIGRTAAQGILRANTPVAVTADSWKWFWEAGAFRALRVIQPTAVTAMNFKSSIDYLAGAKGMVASAIDRLRPPIIHGLVVRKRQSHLNALSGNYRFTDAPSPLHPGG